MFNNAQAEKVPKDLGLSYRWTNPPQGANAIIVEESIEYKPFSCKLKDLRTNKSYTSNTTEEFKRLCRELAEEKKKYRVIRVKIKK